MAKKKPFNKCLLYIFIGLMILTGSINTIFNKILQKMRGKEILFEQHHWIITFGMFIGEMVSVFFYAYIVIKKKKKANEQKKKEEETKKNEEELVSKPEPLEEEDDEEKESKLPPVPTNLIFAITASCDLMATTINTFGLTYLTTSMFQMMRGLELFFVCLWSRVFLKNPIYRHAFLGVGSLIFGLSIVGLNAILYDDKKVAKNPTVGIILLCTSQFFSSTEYVIQEKFIKYYDVHPFQLVGFEGTWGAIMYAILLTIFQFVSCDDWNDSLRNGICFVDDEDNSYIEDTKFAFEQMMDNIGLLIVYLCYIISIALYNVVGIMLTKLVSSTARAVVDTVRTVFIWLFFLCFEPVDGTKETFHILQLVGFGFVVFGTLVYNEILVLKFCNLDYYTRDNIALRAQKDEKDKQEEDRLYNSIDSRNTEGADQNKPETNKIDNKEG
jgi:drug/metabolite transporter (DMT)-like permease